MKKLKIAIIGSGSTYTPELINGFIERMGSLSAGSFYMMDIDAEKNRIVSSLAERMLRAKGSAAIVKTTESLEEAVEGAAYVLGQVRVGKLEARIKDEKIPMKYGLLGQETTGAGGFLKGMRTIPVLMKVARAMERLAPDAWLINFSNPSGMLAQALLSHSPVKAIGLCNNPVNMRRFAHELLPEGTKNFDIDYVGLNHLSWITAVYADGKDILPGLLTHERVRRVNDRLYDEELMLSIGAVPCGYLNYYYLRGAMVKKFAEAEKTRGELCREIERELLELYAREELAEKPAQLDKRGGARYSEAAVSLIDSIENDRGDYHVVNTLNKGGFAFMEDDDVVEIKCRIGKNGPVPEKLENFNNTHIIGMMRAVKAYERLSVEAGLTGDRRKALAALLNNPLVGDYELVKPMLDELLDAHREFLPQFFN